MPDRRRFGLFDFDPATRELRREGVPVKIQAQPAQVLALLIAHAGEVVSREALREAVWGTGTFVDFDRGLNFCIAQIRSALSDSAESPRFIRTIPKKGYQFVAPVSPPPVLDRVAVPVRTGRRVPWTLLLSTLAVMAAAMAGVLIFSWKTPVRVAIALFDNDTGSPDLDALARGLTDSFVAEMASAGPGRFEVIGNAAILREPRMKRDLLAIGGSLKAGYVVLGQIRRDSGRVLAVASLIALPEQTHVKVVRVELDTGNLFNSQVNAARTITAGLLGPVTAGVRVRIPSSTPATH